MNTIIFHNGEDEQWNNTPLYRHPIPIKSLRVMNLLAIFILFLCTFSFAEANAQKVSLEVKNAAFTEVALRIQKQTGYSFSISKRFSDVAKPVTLKVEQADLKQVLEILFKNQPFGYTINGKVISLIDKSKDKRQNQSPNTEQKDQDRVRGRVVDQENDPIADATVVLKGKNIKTSTNENGYFTINAGEGDRLAIQIMGYRTTEIPVTLPLETITLQKIEQEIEEVAVIKTGYQNIPKERATGSFVFIDSALLERSVTTNILERLDGVTSSTIFNKTGGYNTPVISIRGRSTILGNPNPLVVVDNFPYHGDISTINPADVESITILKDAAAASIWGTQAGNGVIVVTTKSGKFNQKTQVKLNSNLTIGQKPRLFTQRQMTSAEYIEVELDMFERGRYNSRINNGFDYLSPAVEIMLQHRNGQIDLDRRNLMLDSLGKLDIRDDLLEYYYRTPVNQQYSLNISGGGQQQKFFLSAGYDRNASESIGHHSERLTINGQNTYNLFNDKLQIVSGLQFSNNKAAGLYQPRPLNSTLFPYMKVADEEGNPIPVPGRFRFSYVAAQVDKGLLDWSYTPLNELKPNVIDNTLNFRIQNNVTYKIANPLKIIAYHSYQKGLSDNSTQQFEDSYYTRDLINSISSINTTTGLVTRPIREGDILQNGRNTLTSQYGRLQLAFDHNFSHDHQLNAIAGAEVSEIRTEGSSSTLYGYDPETGNNNNAAIDFTKLYPRYVGSGTYQIPTGLNNKGLIDRNISYYVNTSYTYRSLYTLSVSARRDQSNIFGVDANQKGVPLWSVGGLWHIYKEDFYQIEWLPQLSIRGTYGYNGNVDKNTSAYLTMISQSNNLYGVPRNRITNPPNPNLRWERVSNLNLALDFATKNKRLSGSIEIYQKHGKDLIGFSPLAPQTGMTQYRGNNANLKTRGVDIILNSQNLTGKVKWQTSFLANYVKDKVSQYATVPGANSSIINETAYNIPLVGFPYNGIFAYRWAGLDETGAPQSYLNGQISKDYSAIQTSTNRDELVYMGSKAPTFYGSLLNTLSYKAIQLSFLINYKTGHVFRITNSLSNSTLYSSVNAGPYTSSPDYGKRWQQPGDELMTNVPSLAYPANSNRLAVYSGSEILVHKADHIRLQDVRLSLDLNSNVIRKLKLHRLSVFAYANNLGILWKANKGGFDPESVDIQQSRSFAFGLIVNL